MPKRDYSGRLAAHFAKADDDIADDCAAMLAEHSATGRLRSGATLSRAADIWVARTGEAVERAQAEFAGIIDRRGGEWRRAMDVVLASLADRRSSAGATLAGTFNTAEPRGGEDSGTMRAVGEMLDRGVESIRERAEAFRDGWTSPKPRSWNERHPVAFALAMLVAGAALSEAGHALVGLMERPAAVKTIPAINR